MKLKVLTLASKAVPAEETHVMALDSARSECRRVGREMLGDLTVLSVRRVGTLTVGETVVDLAATGMTAVTWVVETE